MSQPQPPKALPVVALLARLFTLIFLLASLITLAANSATFTNLSLVQVTAHFKIIYSYRYALSVIVIGLAYTVLQVPFAIHFVSLGKRLVDKDAMLHFDFYGDKIISMFLATGVGAAFGATYDLKINMDFIDNYLKITGDYELSEIRSKLDSFFNMGYVSASLLLIALLCSLLSSVISSLALSNKRV